MSGINIKKITKNLIKESILSSVLNFQRSGRKPVNEVRYIQENF